MISLTCGSRWLSPSRASDGGKRKSGKRRRELCPVDGMIGFGITCCGSGELITETEYVSDDQTVVQLISAKQTDTGHGRELFRIVLSCYAPGVEGFSLTVHSLDAWFQTRAHRAVVNVTLVCYYAQLVSADKNRVA